MNKHVFSNTQSNEVGGSYHMEKEGLQRVLNFLQQQGLTVEVLVTDRHKQINKWLRENYPPLLTTMISGMLLRVRTIFRLDDIIFIFTSFN